ncbi:MAG: peptidoglycan-binding protein LysM [Siphonobacter sp.]
MGLISFMKGVGDKLFGNKEEEAKATQAKPEEVEPLRAGALLQKVKSLGLPYKSLTVKTAGSTVVLEGEVEKQEDAEKIALTVGNVDGVDQVDNRMTVATPAPEAKYYTVVKGDTLSKIAKEFYGDMMKYPVIFEANKPMLKDPDLIYPGQVLRIPAL